MKILKGILFFFKFLYKNRYARVLRASPDNARIVILDSSNAQYMTPLCGDEKYIIIDVDGNELYVTKEIILLTFKKVFKGYDFQVSYVITLLQIIKPNITFTCVDNARLFYEVSRCYPYCRFLAIQNGSRYDVLHLKPERAKEIYIPEFACFGEYEKDLYKRKGATVGKFYPIGSLKNAYYKNKYMTKGFTKEYDICLVAEPAFGWDDIEFDGFEDATGKIAQYVVRFSKKHNKRLCVAGKRDPDTRKRDIELDWYSKYIGSDVEIIPRIRDEFTTYQLIDRSLVSIAFCSTALSEGMGRGNRVLFCNYTGKKRWNFPVDGIWRLEETGYEIFEERVINLLKMTDEEFKQQSIGAANYVMTYNNEVTTDIFLKNIIADVDYKNALSL